MKNRCKQVAFILAAALSLTALLMSTASVNHAAYAAENLDIEVPFATYSLSQGETIDWEVPLRYTVLRPKMDVMYVVDTTGSMAGIRITLANTLALFTAQLMDAGATDINFGATFFADSDVDTPWYGNSLPLGDHSLADVEDALASLYRTGGGDPPEDSIWAYMRAVGETAWREDAERVVVLVTDYPSKVRASVSVGGHPVTAAGARAIAAEKGVLTALLPYGPYYDSANYPGSVTMSNLAASLGVKIRPWVTSMELSAALAAAVIPPTDGMVSYSCMARVESARYSSDNAPSADVSYGISPSSFVIRGGETRSFRVTAIGSGKPARMGDATVVEIGYYVDGIRIGAATQRLHYMVDGHRVTFMDLNGSVLKTEIVLHGGAATAPPVPVRPGWTFLGWDKPFGFIVEDTVVTALYSYNYNTVVFRDWDGTELKRQEVPYGGAASSPANPARIGHIFTGWDKPFNYIVADTVVTAQYLIRYFLVVFEDWNGAMISFGAAPYGSAATAPPDPVRDGLTFIGWNKPFNFVTEDMFITAQFNVNYYKVDFVDWDGAVLRSMEVPYGGSASAPASPERVGWTFVGWDKPFGYITENTTVTAQYVVNYFDVVFEDWDGTELKWESVPYGGAATPPADPTRQGYTFIGWDQDYSFVDAPLKVIARYKGIVIPSILRHEGSLQGAGGDQLIYTVRVVSTDGLFLDLAHDETVDSVASGIQVTYFSLFHGGEYICDYEVVAAWNGEGAVTYIGVREVEGDGSNKPVIG